MGLGLFLAAVLFAYIPLLVVVHVAGYTQRPKRRSTDPIDTYVFDLYFEREKVASFREDEEDLVAFLAKQGGRFMIQPDGSLASIAPPDWLDHDSLTRVAIQ